MNDDFDAGGAAEGEPRKPLRPLAPQLVAPILPQL